MQKVLSFELNKKKYVSNKFDFETLRLINENHLSNEKIGMLSCAVDGVYHMFEGTDATEDILAEVSPEEMIKMCAKVWTWYSDVISEKND